jgi:hypothetical protein
MTEPTAADAAGTSAGWADVAAARPRPVKWLAPAQLLRTGREVFEGALFARYADKRESEANAPRHAYDLSAEPRSGDALWVDYVADTGDGFNATYSIACSVTRAPTVTLDPGPFATPAEVNPPELVGRPGHLLVFGGDEVYPAASIERYDDRLKNVYAESYPRDSPPVPVVAIPGNHDWYDGLVGFRRNFCQSWVKEDTDPAGFLRTLPRPDTCDRIGGWRAFQSRSYFAVKLTTNWWLWGIDIQLDAPIDAEQLAYFATTATLLADDANIILCTARPSWVDPPALDNPSGLSNKQTLTWFVDRIVGTENRHRVRLMLSGDIHHYARYELYAGELRATPQLVTCGGGGAYLAATHHLPDSIAVAWKPSRVRDPAAESQYRRVVEYPSVAESKALRSGLATIPLPRKNGYLFAFVASLYLVLAEALAMAKQSPHYPNLGRLSWRFWADSAQTGYSRVFGNGPLLVAVLLLALLLLRYSYGGREPHRLRTAMGPGLLHLSAHLFVVFVYATACGLLARHIIRAQRGLVGNRTIRLVVLNFLLLLLLLAFGFIGTYVLAGYLMLSDMTGRHLTESFSSMCIEDYKCHLRLRITEQEIRGYAIGIDRVPKQWTGDAPPARPVDMPGISTKVIDTFTVRRA